MVAARESDRLLGMMLQSRFAAEVQARRRALSLGAKDFVAKPFDVIEVGLRIANLLETRILYRRLQAG